MADLDLDNLKKSWQDQDHQNKYTSDDILKMLNKKSKNYVKYILWISIAEFILFGAISIFYMLYDDGSGNIMKLMSKIGIVENQSIKADMAHFNFIIKVLSLVVTGTFVGIFYRNYKKITVESNIKQFILQILKFKKTVKIFINTNIFLLLFFNILITIFIFSYIQKQGVHLENHDWWILVLTIAFTTLFSLLLIFVYYKVFYGILMRKLSKNLKQLQKIEKENILD